MAASDRLTQLNFRLLLITDWLTYRYRQLAKLSMHNSHKPLQAYLTCTSSVRLYVTPSYPTSPQFYRPIFFSSRVRKLQPYCAYPIRQRNPPRGKKQSSPSEPPNFSSLTSFPPTLRASNLIPDFVKLSHSRKKPTRLFRENQTRW